MMHLNQLAKRSFADRTATRHYLAVALWPFLQEASTEYGTAMVTLVYREQNQPWIVRKRATASQIYAAVLALLSRNDTKVWRIGLKAGKKYGVIHLMADLPLVGLDLVYGIEA